MPIKFRCNYCHQFLGISRAQAGGVVDCPTCGRSIRVPQSEGIALAPEEPQLDHADAQLSRALDELARLVDAPLETVAAASSVSHADVGESENQIPQPLLEPIPIEVPLPPTPVAVSPPINVSLTESAAGQGPLTEQALMEELSALTQGLSTKPQIEPPAPSASTTFRRGRGERSTWVLAALIAATFAGGMFMERMARLLEGKFWSEPPAIVLAQPETPSDDLTGRILFRSSEGESQPDRGARLILFPPERTGTVKLSPIGFRAADVSADQQVANAAIQALGGAATTADEHGEYRLSVAAGSYRILILSHYQARPEGETDPELIKLLAEYFDRPAEVLGRVQYQFSPIRLKGTGDVWDHSF